MSKSTYRTYLEKLGNTDAQSFIGQKGDLFFDPEVRALKVSDGVTAGGNAVSGGGGGGSSAVIDGDNAVTAVDSVNEIQIKTNNVDRWDFSSAGHFLPEVNAQYDIGSAERKVRHLFLSDNSLKFASGSLGVIANGPNGRIHFEGSPLEENSTNDLGATGSPIDISKKMHFITTNGEATQYILDQVGTYKGQELIFYIKEHGTPSSGNPSSLVQIVFQGLNSTTFNGTSGTQTQADRSWALTGPNVPDFRTRFSCVWYDNTVGWILSDRNEPSGP